MNSKSMTFAAILVASCGVLLHLYLTFFHSMAGDIYYHIVPLMNMTPYLICIVLTKVTKRPIMPLCAGLLVLLIDFYIFYEYLIGVKTYRHLLIESYQVFLKTAAVLPIGCFIGFLIDKRSGDSAAKRL